MKKLVVEYFYGSEYEGQTVTQCLLYESAEAFYIDFEKALNQYKVDYNVYIAAYEDWRAEVLVISKKVKDAKTKKNKKDDSIEALQKEYSEAYNKQPDLVESDFKIAGATFNLNYLHSKNAETWEVEELHMPDIYTLDEWFEMKLKEND